MLLFNNTYTCLQVLTSKSVYVLCKECFFLSPCLSPPMLCDQADDQMGILELAEHLL